MFQSTAKTFWFRLILLLILAVSIRSIIMIGGIRNPGLFFEPDSRDYHELAQGLALHGSFARNGQTEIFRVPGYPFFLSGFYRLFGESPLPVILFQLLADIGLCLILWRWGARFIHPSAMPVPDDKVGITAAIPPCPRADLLRDAAWWAAVWQALSLTAAVFAGKILSDDLFALLLTVALLLLIQIGAPAGGTDHRRDLAVWLGLGVLLGVLVLWRTVFQPFLLVVAVFLICRKLWRPAVLMSALALLIMAGWSWRNGRATGYYGVSTVGAINLYRYNAAALIAATEGLPFAAVQSEVDSVLNALPSQASAARFAAGAGRKIILQNPGYYAALHLKACLRNLFPDTGDYLRYLGIKIGGEGTLGVIQSKGILAGIRQYFGNRPAAFLICAPDILLTGLKYLLVLYGLGLAWRRFPEHHDVLLLLTAAMVWLLLAPGTASHPRFRVPVEPLLSVYAGLGTAGVMVLFRRRFGRA